MSNCSNVRKQRGQALVEGAVSICMIFASSMAGSLFLLNTGTGIFFKQKLTSVCRSAASYAAAHAGDSDVDAETTSFVEEFMSQVGIAPNNLQVEVCQINVNEDPGVRVTVSNAFPVFGSCNLFPAQMVLSDFESVVW